MMTIMHVALVVLFVAVALLAWNARATWKSIESIGARLGNWQPTPPASSSSSSPAGLPDILPIATQPAIVGLGVMP